MKDKTYACGSLLNIFIQPYDFLVGKMMFLQIVMDSTQNCFNEMKIKQCFAILIIKNIVKIYKIA